jgi:hypothetical protein
MDNLIPVPPAPWGLAQENPGGLAAIGDENAQIPASYLCGALRDFADAGQGIVRSDGPYDMYLAGTLP